MSRFCKYCNSVLSEKTSNGILQFQCECCSYIRNAYPEETLLIDEKINKSYETDFTSSEDIIEDEMSRRIPINCNCGSKVGVLRIIGKECDIIRLCLICKKSF